VTGPPVSEPQGRGAAWTEERGTSDEGRPRLKAPLRRAEDTAFGHVLDQCLGVAAGEEVVLLADEGTDPEVVHGLTNRITERNAVPLVARMPSPRLPGAEPPAAVAAMMLEAAAIIELTSLFIGSSAARRAATGRGARYLAMPGVRLGTFRAGGPLAVDFERLRIDAETVGAAWGRATTFRLTSRGGTDLRGSVEGRPGRVLHGMAREPGAYMAPPDVEAGTAPVILHVDRGELTGVEGAARGRLASMLERCADDRMINLAEVSVAFNPAGTVCSVPMETESSRGSAHIALGNSIAYGGRVNAVAHLDCVMRDAVLELDGRVVIAEGVLR